MVIREEQVVRVVGDVACVVELPVHRDHRIGDEGLQLVHDLVPVLPGHANLLDGHDLVPVGPVVVTAAEGVVVKGHHLLPSQHGAEHLGQVGLAAPLCALQQDGPPDLDAGVLHHERHVVAHDGPVFGLADQVGQVLFEHVAGLLHAQRVGLGVVADICVYVGLPLLLDERVVELPGVVEGVVGAGDADDVE